MPTTRLALIGAGTIGKTHIDRIQRHPGLELAGIADPTPAGQALADSLNVPWAAEPEALLDQVRPQGAIVATPNVAHVPVALECLARGIPALVEKPVADTVAEARALADAVARTIAKPAELPLGVLTAFIGVPLFLAMLRQFRSKV